MTRSLGLGVLAAVAVLGCAAKNNTGDNGSGLSGTGGTPGGTVTGAGGAAPAGNTTTGTGGSSVVTGGTGGASGGSTTAGTGGAAGGSTTAGTGGATGGGAGMGGAGMGGSGGMTGGGTGGMDMPAPNPAFHPPCITKGADLVLIGDSYVNYTVGGQDLQPRLTMHAIADGVLMAGDMFDDHGVPGTSLSAGVTATIPNQWFDECKALKPKFVVMDGGGNDILLYNSQCLPDGAGNGMDPGCQQVVKDATAVAKTMLDDMKASGVSQVLYFFYPDVPAGGHDILAYSFPMAKDQCEAGSDDKFECMMIDNRPLFAGHDDWIGGDGIHPSAIGMDMMGANIWSIMKDHCMAQTEAQNCGCVP